MKFRLLDKDGAKQVHEGVMARIKSAQSVSWGSRVFLRVSENEDGAVYREADNFRIGK